MYARSALARGLRPLPRLETQLAENYVFARSRFQSRRRSRCESSRLPRKKPRHLPVSGHNNRIIILCKVKYTHSTIAYSALLREATLTIYKLTRVRVFEFIICIPPFLAFRVIKSCVNAWRRSHVQIIQALLENVNPVFSFSRHPRVHPGKSCYDSTDITILMSTSTTIRQARYSFFRKNYAKFFALSSVIYVTFKHYDCTTNGPFLQPEKTCSDKQKAPALPNAGAL